MRSGIKAMQGMSATSDAIYDALGRPAKRTMPGGIVTEYAHDALGRLTSLTHARDGEIIDSFKYTHDPAGNIIRIEKYRVGMPGDSGVFNYAYDPLNRLIEASHDGKVKRYAYDAIGNRTSSTQDGITTRHSYNARNQLVRTEGPDGVREYTHDQRGNLTGVTENGRVVASYTFDATDRMTEAVTEKGRAEYVYNGFLKRVGTRHTAPDGTTEESLKYVLDLTKPYNDLLAIEGGHEQRFIWGDELLMSEGTDPGHSFSYLTDHLGSPIRLMGDGHDQAMAYDEFGVPMVEPDPDTGQCPSHHNPFGFTGYQTDGVTGLCYAQARWYDPQISRMSSEDPIKSGLNWYSYCSNNPLRYVDPKGLSLIDSIPKATIELLINLLGKGYKDTIVSWWHAMISKVGARSYAKEKDLHITTKKWYGTKKKYVTWDNEADAFRHFDWNVDMVNSISYDSAIYAANAHEVMGLSREGNIIDVNLDHMAVTANFDFPTLMDLWNNSVGQNLAGMPEHAGKNPRELFDHALSEGMIITSLQDVYTMYGIDESYLIDGLIHGMWDLENNQISFYASGKDPLRTDFNFHLRGLNPPPLGGIRFQP